MLTGSGRAFSAGGDMAWFPELRDPARLHALRREAKQIIWDQLDVEIPIVCALNGPAVGLGASIALLCDVIVMADTAAIIDPHVQVGLVAGDGGAAIWPLLVGPLAAKRHLMLGQPLIADEALRLGVAAEVCAPMTLDDVGPSVGRSDRSAAAARRAGHQDLGQPADQAGAADQLRSVDGARDDVLPLGRPRRSGGRVRREADAHLRRTLTCLQRSGMSLTEPPIELDNTRWDDRRLVVDLLDPDLYRRNPHDVWAWMRANEPVYRDDRNGLWGVTRHADLMDVERRSTVFVSGQGYRAVWSPSRDQHDRPGRPASPPTADARAGRLHQEVGRGRVMPRSSSWSPSVLDAALADGADEMEVIDAVAGQVPARLTARLLGYPEIAVGRSEVVVGAADAHRHARARRQVFRDFIAANMEFIEALGEIAARSSRTPATI